MKEANVWKKCLCVVLVFTTFIAGCGGHAANPVDRYMLGDEKKSCDGLYAEVSQIDKEIVLKNKQKGDRDTWNIIFFVTGFLVIVPWFFIDLKGSQEVEAEALQARKKALQIIFSEKDCTPPEIRAGQKQQKEQTRLLNGVGVTDIGSLIRGEIATVEFQPSLAA
jgi:hypothetical protein